MIRVGTAGWTLPRSSADAFPADGSHLQRYANVFGCVEVNSSFYKPHRGSTWERWAASTPDAFRFSAKMPKTVTHGAKLRNTGGLLLPFFEEVSGLNSGFTPKLGSLLVQLPPSLVFDEGVVREFLGTVRELYDGPLALEPRNASWFAGDADQLLREFGAARVAADPPAGSPRATEPGGSPALQYWRLHGAPRTYYSEYSEEFLKSLAGRLHADAQRYPEREAWVIFDNTTLGHATRNALLLQEFLHGK